MNTLLQQFFKTVSKTGQFFFHQKQGKIKSTAFHPAPSYWALIPVRVQASVPHKQRKGPNNYLKGL